MDADAPVVSDLDRRTERSVLRATVKVRWTRSNHSTHSVYPQSWAGLQLAPTAGGHGQQGSFTASSCGQADSARSSLLGPVDAVGAATATPNGHLMPAHPTASAVSSHGWSTCDHCSTLRASEHAALISA